MDHRSDADLWGLIGGTVDDGESVRQCLDREVREETGLALGSYDLLGIYSDPTRVCAYPDGNVFQSVTVAFVGELPPDAVFQVSPESRELAVMSWSRIARIGVPATHIQIIRDARSWALDVDPRPRID